MSRNYFVPNVIVDNDEFVFNRPIRGAVLSTAVSNVSESLTVNSLGEGVVHSNSMGAFSSSPVVTNDLANGAVTNSKLSENSVTKSKIADGAVDTDELADDSVTTSKILNANVTNAKLADDSVTTSKIADANVTNAKLADDSVTTSKIANASITTPKLDQGAVTTPKLADNSVRTDKIIDANVTTPKLADGAVTTAKVADGSITAEKLAPGALAGAGAFSFIGGYINLQKVNSPYLQYVAFFCAGSGQNNASPTTNPANAVMAIPNNCTIKKFYVYTDAAPTSTTYTFTFRKGATVATLANTPLSAVIGIGQTTASDTTHSATITAGELCCIEILNTNTAGNNAGNYKWIALVQ